MKITMISNAMSHHQKPLCDALAAMSEVEFYFIATKPLTIERRRLGYSDLNYSADYIVRSYESDELQITASKTIESSDFVITGSAPYWMIKDCLKKKKEVFLYSERIFKRKNRLFNLKLLLIYILQYGRYIGENVRVLCASAYAPQDFKKVGFRENQFLKWGYFPKACTVDIETILNDKIAGSIVWVGRMIPWKHPETVLAVAKKLKNDDVLFHLTMVGNGSLYETIQTEAGRLGLKDVITFTGALPTERVREVMERSEIMITTSDQNEGWGAVINEGMSSACAVCASREMGAAPYLIRDEENGYLFHYSDTEALYLRVKELLQNSRQRERVAKAAAETIKSEWNGERAASKLVGLCRKIQSGDAYFSYSEGVCSRAEAEEET